MAQQYPPGYGAPPYGMPQPVPVAPPPARKEMGTIFLVSMFLGTYGVDRFLLGQTGMGVAKLLTCGGAGVWSIIDVALIGMGRMRDASGSLLDPGPVFGTPVKSQATAFLLSYFLGTLGIDRFYLGYTGLGILKLVTCGGLGVWALIDAILIGMGKLRDADGNSLFFDQY